MMTETKESEGVETIMDNRWRRAWAVVDREAGEEPITRDARLSPAAMRCVKGIFEEIGAKRVLELGSGASTLMLGGICKRYGCVMDSVDHDLAYFETTRQQLLGSGLNDVVRLHHAPIAPVTAGSYVGLGYRLGPTLAGGPYDLALIDGPPSLNVGRFMTLLTIWPQLMVGAVIILDDARREALEGRWLHEWGAIFGTALRAQVHLGYAKGLAVLQKREAGPWALQPKIALPHAWSAARWVARNFLHKGASA